MMRKVALPAMRTDCNAHIFEDICFAAKEPIMQFDAWFKEATTAEDIGEPNLMVLTTCGRLVKFIKASSVTSLTLKLRVTNNKSHVC